MALLVQCQSVFKLFYVYIAQFPNHLCKWEFYRHQSERGTEKAVMAKSLLMV